MTLTNIAGPAALLAPPTAPADATSNSQAGATPPNDGTFFRSLAGSPGNDNGSSLSAATSPAKGMGTGTGAGAGAGGGTPAAASSSVRANDPSASSAIRQPASTTTDAGSSKKAAAKPSSAGNSGDATSTAAQTGTNGSAAPQTGSDTSNPPGTSATAAPGAAQSGVVPSQRADTPEGIVALLAIVSNSAKANSPAQTLDSTGEDGPPSELAKVLSAGVAATAAKNSPSSTGLSKPSVAASQSPPAGGSSDSSSTLRGLRADATAASLAGVQPVTDGQGAMTGTDTTSDPKRSPPLAVVGVFESQTATAAISATTGTTGEKGQAATAVQLAASLGSTVPTDALSATAAGTAKQEAATAVPQSGVPGTAVPTATVSATIGAASEKVRAESAVPPSAVQESARARAAEPASAAAELAVGDSVQNVPVAELASTVGAPASRADGKTPIEQSDKFDPASRGGGAGGGGAAANPAATHDQSAQLGGAAPGPNTQLSSTSATNHTSSTASTDPLQRSQQIVDHVTNTLRTAFDTGGELRVRLEPPELGKVQVEVSARDGGLTARLEVQTPAARQTLLDNISVLHDAIAGTGASLNHVEVVVAPQPKDSSTGERPSSGSQQNGSGQGNSQGQSEDQSNGQKQNRNWRRSPAIEELDIEI